MISMLLFPVSIVTMPTEKPNFSSADTIVPDIINLIIDKSDIITGDDVKQLFMNILHDDDIAFLKMDSEYYKASYSEYKRFLYDTSEWSQKSKYVPIFNDCDDYSFKIYGLFCQNGWSGLPVGIIIWSNPRHADPFFIDDNMDIWIIEDYNNITEISDYLEPDYRISIVII